MSKDNPQPEYKELGYHDPEKPDTRDITDRNAYGSQPQSLRASGGLYRRLLEKDGTTYLGRLIISALTSLPTGPIAGQFTLVSSILRIWNGSEWLQIQGEQRSRVSTQFDKASDTTLANVTGLSANVAAGKSYAFRAVLFVDADATGGHKYAIGGTATATAIRYQIQSIDNGSPGSLRITSRQIALAGSAGQAGQTAYITTIEGLITVNAAGTLTVQFAQNAANGTSSVLTLSHFSVREIA